ncbi:Uncharacterised protein [Vibrio cholerae]|nr:Uncharacterised protein [Vibrio cholerae]CSI19307.1 Uncharacterised protein [Vibrio cholerae]CSI45459.1 Uncharacterised protein [Vibrio cholerae]
MQNFFAGTEHCYFQHICHPDVNAVSILAYNKLIEKNVLSTKLFQTSANYRFLVCEFYG